MKTNKDILYHFGQGDIAVIPAGTTIERARNLPDRDDGQKQYWSKGWRGMRPQERSWIRTYGFLILQSDLS